MAKQWIHFLLVFKKNIMSHNQVICLVRQALDPMDVPHFMSSMETIKTTNGQFPIIVPLSVSKEIFDKFCVSKDTNRRVEVVDMYDSDYTEVTQVKSPGMGKSGVGSINDNHFQNTYLGSCTLFGMNCITKKTLLYRKFII